MNAFVLSTKMSIASDATAFAVECRRMSAWLSLVLGVDHIVTHTPIVSLQQSVTLSCCCLLLLLLGQFFFSGGIRWGGRWRATVVPSAANGERFVLQ